MTYKLVLSFMFNKSSKIKGGIVFKFSGISKYNCNLSSSSDLGHENLPIDISRQMLKLIQNLYYRGTQTNLLSFGCIISFSNFGFLNGSTYGTLCQLFVSVPYIQEF